MKNHIEIEKKKQKIRIYGNRATIDRAHSLIDKLDLTGNEASDRLLIQKCIDDNKIGAKISYNGNSVYSFNKIVKQYRNLQKKESLVNLTNDMYEFFMNACGDIAHYDIGGYIHHYDLSFRKLEFRFLRTFTIDSRFADVDKIIKHLNIGNYYKNRKFEDLNKLSLKGLKQIIEKSDGIVVEKEKDWEIQLKIDDNNKYVFDLDISSGKVGDISSNILEYSEDFIADEYANYVIRSLDNISDYSIRDILNMADCIQKKLYDFADNVSYRCRVEVECMNDLKKEIDIDKEMER